jgi:RimJ/RimL family protein N-acetyltransferase
MNDPPATRGYRRNTQLRDGTPVLIRAIRPDDRERIVSAFHKLDPQTLYNRFFTFKRDITEQDLARIDASDFVHAAVLVATQGSGAGEVIIGAASCIRIDNAPEPSAEVSFTIEEDYHGQGLASQFLAAFAGIARGMGVQVLVADVLAANTAMLSVFEGSGLPLKSTREDGIVHVRMDLRDAGSQAGT